MRIEYCLNHSCNKTPLEIQKGYSFIQNGIEINVPNVEIEICPLCQKEYHNSEAMKKISEVVEKTFKKP